MELADIRELPSVVERLKAIGPSGVRGPHCWFCGKIETWFQCDCPEAREAQQGKRAKPRYDAKKRAMILDEDIIQRNLAWGYGRRYVAAKPTDAVHVPRKPKPVNSEPVHAADSVNRTAEKSVHAPASVNTAVNRDTTEPVHAESEDDARKAYRREWQRKKRAALAAKQQP